MADNTEGNEPIRQIDDEETEEWSDNMCIRISLEDSFPAIVRDKTIQKGIINRFLNFYLSGKVQKGLNARDIIFAVISIIPYSLKTEELIWNDNEFSDDGKLFFLTPDDKLKTDINSILTQRLKIKDDQLEKNNNITDNETKISENSITELKLENEKCTDCNTPDIPDQVSDAVHDEKSSLNESYNINEDASEDIGPSPLDTLGWFRKKPINKQPISIEANEYGSAENAAFCISCNKLLDLWNSDIRARIYLKYFFGFAALSLMRTVAKSYHHVIKMFQNTFPRTVSFTADLIKYSPPSNACVTTSFKTFRRVERQTQIMFAKLVINSFLLNYKLSKEIEILDISDTGGVRNMLRITVLSHLSHYGMELINMLQEIASRTCFSRAFKSLYSEETAFSWNKVNNFFKKYMYESARQRTFHWAPIIDRKQFKYLSCENNFELAVVTAVFVEKLSFNEGIWNARWVKSGKNLETYKKLGLKMYEDYSNQKELFLGFDILRLSTLVANLKPL
ncbi:uncharacterized protein LOC125071033 [Vanessa atalanta]|uniref:uncharacterized protein LOC125071033 n=1 Tax=Vanessa atalanta TaxID=42275 RepID=UPI001FCD9A90|nr:uncharacterized protein LOC125071033 [Vanessa atalanta]XP_047537043.1 uncharacterized protein LOC125071033 [Vanessa atalanta]